MLKTDLEKYSSEIGHSIYNICSQSQGFKIFDNGTSCSFDILQPAITDDVLTKLEELITIYKQNKQYEAERRKQSISIK